MPKARCRDPKTTHYAHLVDDDLALDGTRITSERERRNRFGQGAKWRPQTCATDTAIMICRFLDIGRTKCDQLLPVDIIRLTFIARETRLAIPKWYGTMTLEQVDEKRELVTATPVTREKLTKTKRYGNPFDVSCIARTKILP